MRYFMVLAGCCTSATGMLVDQKTNQETNNWDKVQHEGGKHVVAAKLYEKPGHHLFSCGAEVLITGLKISTQLNGRSGTILGFDKENKKWIVQLTPKNATTEKEKPIGVSPDKLKPLTQNAQITKTQREQAQEDTVGQIRASNNGLKASDRVISTSGIKHRKPSGPRGRRQRTLRSKEF